MKSNIIGTIVIALTLSAILISAHYLLRLYYDRAALRTLSEASKMEGKPVSDFRFTELTKGEPDMYVYDSLSSPGLEIVVLVHWTGRPEISTWHPEEN